MTVSQKRNRIFNLESRNKGLDKIGTLLYCAVMRFCLRRSSELYCFMLDIEADLEVEMLDQGWVYLQP